MNTQSDNIADLAAALAKAQADIGSVHKDAANPYFKSSYATLAAVWEAVRPTLSKNGLSVVQMPGSDERGYYVQTQLMHSSGQWVRSTTYMKPAKEDPQGIGSLISYARRYALQAMVMACPDDDDGEAAMGRSKPAPKVEAPKAEPEPELDEKPKSPKFSGPNHKGLFEELAKAGYTPGDFLGAMHHAGAVPEKANDFYKMKDETAQKFLKDIKQTIGVIVEWKAIYEK